MDQHPESTTDPAPELCEMCLAEIHPGAPLWALLQVTATDVLMLTVHAACKPAYDARRAAA